MESKATKQHKKKTRSAKAAVITLSDTRDKSSDKSGKLISMMFEKNGHEILFHDVIPDEASRLRSLILQLAGTCDCIITNGGTGISKRDITVETMLPLFDKELTSFQTLFAKLSHEEIGSAALLSRATAGIVQGTVVFCVPGNPNAVSLAVEKLILPELDHILNHIN